MTNKEAIEKFKKIKKGNIYLIHQRIEGKEVYEDYSLCDMAISALQAQDVSDTNVEDTISRQVAIDALGYCQTYLFDSRDKDKKISLEDAEYAIEQLSSSQPKQRWIPITEKLPAKKEERYWICTDTGYQCQCRWTNNIFGIGISEDWGWKIVDIPQYTKVAAWMPLPKPYSAEGRTDGK